MVVTVGKPNIVTNHFVHGETATTGNRAANIPVVARTVGELIADARSRVKGHGRHGMSQADLISAMGLPGSARSWLAQVETGRTLKPDPERLRMIADVLGTVTYRELLAASDQLDVLAQPSGEAKPQPVPVTTTTTAPDLSALLQAMATQTTQQAQLITLLTEQNAMLKRLLWPADDTFEASDLTSIGRAAGRLAHAETAPAAATAPPVVLRPASEPHTPSARRRP